MLAASKRYKLEITAIPSRQMKKEVDGGIGRTHLTNRSIYSSVQCRCYDSFGCPRFKRREGDSKSH